MNADRSPLFVTASNRFHKAGGKVIGFVIDFSEGFTGGLPFLLPVRFPIFVL